MSAVSSRRARGYLLLEAAVGGAIIAVIAAGVISQVVHARILNIALTRDATASQLVLQRLEQVRSYGSASAGNFAALDSTIPSDPGAQPGYTRTTTVTSTGCPVSSTIGGVAVSLDCKLVTVAVSYTINLGHSGSPFVTRTSRASTRVFKP